MHLCIILPRYTQNIYDLTNRIISFLRPFNNFYYHLIPILCTSELFFRDKYIVREILAIHYKKSKMSLHLQNTYKSALSTFKNLNHCTFGIGTFSFCKKLYTNPVTIHRMLAVSLRDIYNITIVVRNKEILSVASPFKPSIKDQSSVIYSIPTS